MHSHNVVLATLGVICLSGFVRAGSYGVAPAAASAYQAVYTAPEYGSSDAASVITDIAAAKASAAKLGPNVNWAALNNHGHQIGVPLLVKNYGPLTSLYAALAPKRSFVDIVDAGFRKDSHGNNKFNDKYTVGAYQAVHAAPEYGSSDAAEAAASAITDIAAAKASAAKLGPNVNWAALNNYGHQIGVPLLVKNYGPLTSLYAALAPKRSFVGTVDAGFRKDSYGNIKFNDEYTVGAISI